MTSRCVGPLTTVLLAAAIAIASSPIPAAAGPGEAGGGRGTSSPSRPDLTGVNFVVLVWYRGDAPLETFQYQTYDVRKGEYTAAVNAWIDQIRRKYPRYVVHADPVRLSRERGATEKLKVGSVIHRELLLAAARSGVVLGAPMRLSPGPAPTRPSTAKPDVWTESPGAGGSSNLNLPGQYMPFPVPYVRPHP